MEPSELSSSLALALARPGYGQTVEEILETCRLAVQAQQVLPAEELTPIRHDAGVSDQVWRRMLAIGRNNMIYELRNKLPGSFSALYRASLLGEDLLKEAIENGDIDTNSPTRQIEDYLRTIRIQSAFRVSKKKVYMFCLEELPQDVFEELLDELNVLGKKYLVFFDSQDLEKVRQADAEYQHKRKYDEVINRIYQLIGKHQELLDSCPIIPRSSGCNGEDKKEIQAFGFLYDTDIKALSKFLVSLAGSRTRMMEEYGLLYCYKIAQQYLLTSSRSQRYNYKRRLGEIAEKYPQLSADIDHIASVLTV